MVGSHKALGVKEIPIDPRRGSIGSTGAGRGVSIQFGVVFCLVSDSTGVIEERLQLFCDTVVLHARGRGRRARRGFLVSQNMHTSAN